MELRGQEEFGEDGGAPLAGNRQDVGVERVAHGLLHRKLEPLGARKRQILAVFGVF